jgi:hypothetical protein
MNLPPIIDEQEFSEQTLKGYLLKNVDPTNTNPIVQKINKYLTDRVELFWVEVVGPLREQNRFDPNKLMWYYEIYREGLDANKLVNNKLNLFEFNRKQVEELVKYFESLTFEQHLQLGTSILSNSYMLLSSWLRDDGLVYRYNSIYKDHQPHEWIIMCEDTPDIMKNSDTVAALPTVLKNISLIIAKRL